MKLFSSIFLHHLILFLRGSSFSRRASSLWVTFFGANIYLTLKRLMSSLDHVTSLSDGEVTFPLSPENHCTVDTTFWQVPTPKHSKSDLRKPVVGKLFLKGADNKYFRLHRLNNLCGNSVDSAKTAIDNIKINVCGCVSAESYLEKQASLLTSDLRQ